MACPAPLAAVLSGALALRLWALARAHGHASDLALTVDSWQYLATAQALVGDLAYAVEPGGPPTALRPPGYSGFLAGVWLVTPDSPWWPLAAQAVVSVLGLALLYHLAVRLLGRSALALGAVAVVAADPVQVLASGRVLSETLFTTLVLGVALAATGAIDRQPPRLGRLAAAGGLLAAATFVRPSTYYLPLVLAVLAAAWARRQGARTMLLVVAAVALPSVVACGAWQLRNHQRVGTYAFAATEGYTLYFHSAVTAVALEEGRDPAEVRREFVSPVGIASHRSAEYGEIPDRYPTVGAWYDDLRRRGVKIILGHPRGAAEMTARSVDRVLTDAPRRPFERYTAVGLPAGLAVLTRLLPLVLLAGAVVGGDRLVRGAPARHRFAGAVVVAATLYLVLFSFGGQVDTRFRVPITPFLAIAAMAGAHRLWTWVTHRRAGRPEPATAG